jgi:predicted Zn-dependent peptidase
MKTKFIYLIALFLITTTLSAQIDRSIQPKPGPVPKINLGKPKTFELKNGLKVLVVENHKLPRVSATLTIENGPIFEGDKTGVSTITGSLLGSGSKNISKNEFNEEVDYLGASISFGSQNANLTSLSKYFPRVLELMADAAINPYFSEEDFIREVNILKENVKSEENSVQSIANRVQDLLAYGKNHPYGEYISLKTIENISLADVQTFYNTYFRPNNAYLIIVGDVDFKEVKQIVTKNFSNWENKTLPAYTIPAVKNVAKTEIDFINMPNAVQSDITILSTVDFNMNNPDYFAVLLANQILGGDSNSYLMMSLRETYGYTYDARSNIRPNKFTAALFTAGTQVRNAVTDSATTVTLDQINKIRTTKVSTNELELVKATYAGSFVRNIEKPEVVARCALNIEINNLPENFYETYLDNFNAVTIEDIERVSEKYFSVNQARIVITGKAIDVLPGLEKLSYKINYYDKEGNPTSKPELTKPIPNGVSKETVINNYFNAIGGIDKINTIKSTLTSYEATAMGNTFISTDKRTANKYTNIMSMGGNIMSTIIMTKDAVTMNNQPLPPALSSEMTYTLGVFEEIGLLNNQNSKLTGIENIEGKDLYTITTNGDIISSTIYYDVETGLKVKESQVITMQGQTQTQETNYSDYQDYNGIKFPTSKNGNLGPQQVSFKLIEVKLNEGLSESDF